MWLVKPLLFCLYLAIVSASTPQKVGAVERVDGSPAPTSLTREESQLKLHWLTEDSLELQNPDGSTTKILLRPTSNIQDEPTPCLFTGQLEDDLDSRVTVSGCLGDEETAVTIASSKVDGGVVDLSFTDTATYQLGLIASADSLSRAEDAIRPGDVRRTRRSTSGDTEESDIKLQWVTDKKEIKITFANGNVDKILLAKVDNIQGVDVGCLFTGVLEGDHDSEVDVDGCMSDAETIVEIHSVLVPCGFADLLLTKADTYILKQDEEHIPELVKGEDAADALMIPADATDNPQSNVRPWPTSKPLPKVASLETRVKYDQGLVSATGGQTEAKRFISRAVEHAKTRLHMLPIKVELSVVGTMEYVNQNWRADGSWINKLRDANADKVISHFCAGGAAGIAYLSTVCGGAYGVNINEHINWPGRAEWVTGRTFAHELGHNLGMHHDFDTKHGGDSRPGSGGSCDGEGLMSYGSCKPSCRDSQMPDRWSACSVSDFESTFRSSTHRCLAMGQGDTPHTQAGCTCNDHLQRGLGQCKNRASCGNWCYVNEGNSCSYSYRSYIGSPFRWTCEACDNTRTGQAELVAPPCPFAYSKATAFSFTFTLLVFSGAAALFM
jgi:hypothetical protein